MMSTFFWEGPGQSGRVAGLSWGRFGRVRLASGHADVGGRWRLRRGSGGLFWV